MKYDVIIIGGGAAGLTAALSASGQGAKALLLEGAPRVGRKLLATGNGRCNLANNGAPRYYGCQALVQGVLKRCPPGRVLRFFHELGLLTVEEEGGRVYPACGQAAAVLDVLRGAAERRGVPTLCDAPVLELTKIPGGFRAHTPQGAFQAPAVVAACGGMAGGKLGHDGSPYALLTRLGHTLIPPRPALTQLVGEKGAVRGLSGLRLPALLTLCAGETPVSAAQGEALFTDYGVSGVCAMQLSRDARALAERGEKPVLYLDFSPMLGIIPRVYDRAPAKSPFLHVPVMEECLRARAHTLPSGELLCGLAPRLLAQRLAGLSIGDQARALAAFPVPLTGVRGLEYAQVTQGGIAGEEFDPRTLASRKAPGLFAAGEMLDVDGDCGGYNLLFAFASGLLAGAEAARWPERCRQEES